MGGHFIAIRGLNRGVKATHPKTSLIYDQQVIAILWSQDTRDDGCGSPGSPEGTELGKAEACRATGKGSSAKQGVPYTRQEQNVLTYAGSE
ncbi:hypothetical protein JRQ81_008167 [Phrynocephalus forsythii]|uniref:Uncharacterized protein n=1 Tax=Phrynocephalus forsythii TaxID=171643 RepID=A0A9Q0XBJ1_9SAUR|nr:hypothetical protein JRQ81_008167 [Phrynocephalus forsythii]